MGESNLNENYLKLLVDKLSTQDKKVFIAGDFNFDLLKTSIQNDTFDFLIL